MEGRGDTQHSRWETGGWGGAEREAQNVCLVGKGVWRYVRTASYGRMGVGPMSPHFHKRRKYRNAETNLPFLSHGITYPVARTHTHTTRHRLLLAGMPPLSQGKYAGNVWQSAKACTMAGEEGQNTQETHS